MDMETLTQTLTEALFHSLWQDGKYNEVELKKDHVAVNAEETTIRIYIRLADDVLSSGKLIDVNHAADETGVIYIRAVPAALAMYIADSDFIGKLMWRITESHMNMHMPNLNQNYPWRVNNQPS